MIQVNYHMSGFLDLNIQVGSHKTKQQRRYYTPPLPQTSFRFRFTSFCFIRIFSQVAVACVLCLLHTPTQKLVFYSISLTITLIHFFIQKNVTAQTGLTARLFCCLGAQNTDLLVRQTDRKIHSTDTQIDGSIYKSYKALLHKYENDRAF